MTEKTENQTVQEKVELDIQIVQEKEFERTEKIEPQTLQEKEFERTEKIEPQTLQEKEFERTEKTENKTVQEKGFERTETLEPQTVQEKEIEGDREPRDIDSDRAIRGKLTEARDMYLKLIETIEKKKERENIYTDR